mgnify:CR=1 FL=1
MASAVSMAVNELKRPLDMQRAEQSVNIGWSRFEIASDQRTQRAQQRFQFWISYIPVHQLINRTKNVIAMRKAITRSLVQVQVTALLKAAKNMHPRRKTHAIAPEGLQAAPDDGIFLQNGDFVAPLGQQCPCNQTANATSYDDASFHFRKVWVSIT